MRCPKGFEQKPPKSGNCVEKKSKTVKGKTVKSKTVKNKTTKRCPKGQHKNKKTGLCEEKIKKQQHPKTMWKIKEIEVIYPSSNKFRGDVNVEKISLSNDEGDEVMYINYENKSLYIKSSSSAEEYEWETGNDAKKFVKKHIKNPIDIDSLKSNSYSDLSNIFIDLFENDDDNNYSAAQNYNAIINGLHGEYMKMENVNTDYIDHFEEKEKKLLLDAIFKSKIIDKFI